MSRTLPHGLGASGLSSPAGALTAGPGLSLERQAAPAMSQGPAVSRGPELPMPFRVVDDLPQDPDTLLPDPRGPPPPDTEDPPQ